MPDLLLATGNPGKVLELKDLLAPLSFNLLTPDDLHLYLDVQEDGQTYQENAHKKARAYAQASGLPTLADDSGLEVVVLHGEPGIYSARYGPYPHAADAERRAYLLEKLRPHPRPWEARFIAVVALVLPNGKSFFGRGSCRGEIIPDERGRHGFGYDPIFYIAAQQATMAELSMAVKNRLSHRANAIHDLWPDLENLSRQ